MKIFNLERGFINMLNSKLKNLKEFHGHLGPYVVVGFKMGVLACEQLGKGKGLHCAVKTGLVKPLSCIIDGIQYSSSCTLGKGNIKVEDERKAEAEFIKDIKKIKIKLKVDVKGEIDRKIGMVKDEKLALRIYKMKDEELLDYELELL
ncbi:MAG: formylmethanofuran dehydrogenase subunit E family protein [Candidatus Thermoplasmatota archaeon]|nr:formylmethanofuran dehydrogenase subunit E family protein [Candidatus Thermoplasmatota archaeon]